MSNRSMRSAVIMIAAAVVSGVPAPAEAQNRLRGAVRFGLEHGGDKVTEFQYVDGSSPDVVAGGGLIMTVGGAVEALRFGTHAVDAQLQAGLKYRTIPPATNQDANWLRFPVEGLLFYRLPNGLRFGAGATMHLHNVYAASGEVLNDRVEFRAKPGALMQVEWARRNLAFDLRYTALKYELESGGTGTVDASSIGLGMTVFFGR